MLTFIGIILLVIVVAAIIWVSVLKTEKRDVLSPRVILFQEVYDFFKNSGYLNVCGKTNYKYSTYRLKLLINNEELANLNINEKWKAKKINGVGAKVYELITHLVERYKNLDNIPIAEL